MELTEKMLEAGCVDEQLPELWRDQFMETREIPGRGLCAVQRFVYTCGLLTNLRFDGPMYDYSARYCYPIAKNALKDLAAWDGVGDPPGEWVKEKVSERTREHVTSDNREASGA